MKLCPQCGDTYSERIDYCFADGAVLQLAPSALDAPMPRSLGTPRPRPRRSLLTRDRIPTVASAPEDAPEAPPAAPLAAPPPPPGVLEDVTGFEVEDLTAGDLLPADHAPEPVAALRVAASETPPPPRPPPTPVMTTPREPERAPFSGELDDVSDDPFARRSRRRGLVLLFAAFTTVAAAVGLILFLGIGVSLFEGKQPKQGEGPEAVVFGRAVSAEPSEPIALRPPEPPAPLEEPVVEPPAEDPVEDDAVAVVEPPPEEPPAAPPAQAEPAPLAASRPPPSPPAAQTPPVQSAVWGQRDERPPPASPPPASGSGSAVWDAPPTPTAGDVRIASDPPGAEVIVDGSARGVTPVEVTLPFGDHAVELRLDGYKTVTRSIEVKSTSVAFPHTLEREKRQIAVMVFCAGRGGDLLFVDGRQVGPLPARAVLTEGEHRFMLTGAEGVLEVTRTVVPSTTGETPKIHLNE